ncbi:MAG: hypothetical protein GX557_00650, partial [Chloroflexi bacterium]|nr:hypothetical protein [Chloroflexota bacterium]
GPGVSYAKLASQVDQARIVAHTQALVELQGDDPGFGSSGAHAAAEYLAAQLDDLGALPAATTQDYMQPVERLRVRRLSEPLLQAAATGTEEWHTLTCGADFAETIERHGGAGQADGTLLFVGFGRKDYAYRDYRGLDLQGRVVLVRGDNMPAGFDNEALIRGAAAVLILTDDIAPRLDAISASEDVLTSPPLPILRVRPAAIEPWLSAAGYAPGDLDALVIELGSGRTPGWAVLELPLRVRARVELSAPEVVTGYNVLAILPGNDLALDTQALLVGTAYELPEPLPGHPAMAPSDGPAGAAMLLEIVRLWRAESFKPRRAVLLCFWAGGHLHHDGALTYEAVRSPYVSLEREASLRLDNVGGAGAPEDAPLTVTGPANAPLAALIVRSAGVLEVPATAALSEDPSPGGTVRLTWPGAPNVYSGADTLERLSADRLGQVGQVLNLTLITATRQYHY